MTLRRKLLYSLAAVVIAVALIEGIARLLESRATPSVDRTDAGWQASFFSRHFDWHEPDPDLLWRFRPNLSTDYVETNQDHLIGAPVAKPKPTNSFRVLLLGDSSPVGLGLLSYRQAFGSVLAGLLQDELPDGMQVDLVNAAVAGYTSEQARRWFELYGREFDPDLVVLYVGNNDASVSGTVSDAELLAAQELKGLRRALSKLALYRVLRSLLIDRNKAGELNPGSLVVRVSAERYGRNVTRIVSGANQGDVPVVVVNPIVPYLWPAGLQFKVFEQMRTGQGDLLLPEPMRQVLGRQVKYCIDWADFARRYGQADWYTRAVHKSAFTDNLPPERAVAYYSGQLSTNPDEPVAINNLGVSLWEAKRVGEARSRLEGAVAAFEKRHPPPRSPVETSAGGVFRYNLGVAWLSSGTGPTEAPDTTRAVELLRSALRYDYLSLRIKETYSRALRDRLAEMQPGIWTLVRLDSAFGRTPDTPLGAEKMFIDHCHPTAEGHRRIAGTILLHLLDRGWLPERDEDTGSPE